MLLNYITDPILDEEKKQNRRILTWKAGLASNWSDLNRKCLEFQLELQHGSAQMILLTLTDDDDDDDDDDDYSYDANE